MFKKLAITVILLLSLPTVKAQNAGFTDLGKIEKYDTMLNRLSYFIDYSRKTTIDDALEAPFSYPGGIFPFSEKKLGADYFIRLSVTNSGIPDTFWLYMGRAQHYTMYEYDSSSRKMKVLNNKITSTAYRVLSKVPYAYFVVKQGEYKHFYIQAKINFYNWHQFDPVVVIPHKQTDFIFDHFIRPNKLFIYATLVFLGVMLSMLVYTLMAFIQSLKNEYLYYTLAMFGFIVYFSLRLFNTFIFNGYYYYFYDLRYQVLQLGESTLALLFITSFLNLKKKIPRLYRHARRIIIVQIIFLVVNLPLTYTDQYNYIGNIAFDTARLIALPYFIYMLIVLLKLWRDKEVRYIAAGSITAIVVWCLIVIIDRGGEYKYHFLEHSGITTLSFMTGIIIEMLFFMQALFYRKRMQEAAQVRELERLKLTNDRKDLEKYKAVIDARDKERNRISQEIHDEIGSGLTSIRLLSEINRIKAANDETNKVFEKISDTANSLMDNMNEIIWTLNSKNDTLPNLIAYLRHFIVEYFEPLPIQLRIAIPDTLNEIPVSGKIRRNILLSVKEALHNIVKHAKATEVNVHFTTDTQLSITISDNGIGFNPARVNPHNNGLQNIKDRLQAIGGSCTISHHNGTSVLFELPLP